MSKQNLILITAILTAAALFITASANPTWTTEQAKDNHSVNDAQLADLLGIDKSELSEKMSKGDNIYDVLVTAGRLDDYKKLWLELAEANLENYISQGMITRDQAETRYEKYKNKLDKWDGTTDIYSLFRIITKK